MVVMLLIDCCRLDIPSYKPLKSLAPTGQTSLITHLEFELENHIKKIGNHTTPMCCNQQTI